MTQGEGKQLDLLANIREIVGWFDTERALILPFVLTIVLYVVFGKKDELSRHAIQNTAATIVVTGVNLGFIILFFREINAVAQAAYNALGIPTLDAAIWDATPFWLVCILGLMAKDAADYGLHRLMHTRWVWPTHAAHHSDTYVNAFTTFRVHFLEHVLMSLTYIVTLTWLQMPEAIPFVAVLSLVHNMYVHLDLNIGHGPLKYLIASPNFHRWHHADVPEAHGKNLANIMPIFDLVFGTYYYPERCREKMGALSSGIEDKNPLSIWLYPFQEWARLIRQSTKRATLGRATRRKAASRSTDATPAE